MTSKPQWIRCGRCGCRFRGSVPVDVPLARFVSAIGRIRCICCGAGSSHIGFGGGMTLEEDRKFRNVPADATLADRAADWARWGDVGVSSAAFVRHLSGHDAMPGVSDGNSTPSDPSDFRRILLALDRMPELRDGIGRMASISAGWAALTERFADIEAVFLREAGPEMDGPSAPSTYEMLRTIDTEREGFR